MGNEVLEKDKYYTPSIEEFHVGFEYEMNDGYKYNKQVFPNPWWNDGGMGGLNTLKNCLIDKGAIIRVKYLDREDIESLGFKQVNEEVTYYTLNNFNLFFEYTKSTVLIDQRIIGTNGGYNDFRVFKGILKNKSELFSQLKRNGVI